VQGERRGPTRAETGKEAATGQADGKGAGDGVEAGSIHEGTFRVAGP
jgi:hypothetical protein